MFHTNYYKPEKAYNKEVVRPEIRQRPKTGIIDQESYLSSAMKRTSRSWPLQPVLRQVPRAEEALDLRPAGSPGLV